MHYDYESIASWMKLVKGVREKYGFYNLGKTHTGLTAALRCYVCMNCPFLKNQKVVRLCWTCRTCGASPEISRGWVKMAYKVTKSDLTLDYIKEKAVGIKEYLLSIPRFK